MKEQGAPRERTVPLKKVMLASFSEVIRPTFNLND